MDGQAKKKVNINELFLVVVYMKSVNNLHKIIVPKTAQLTHLSIER